MHEDGIEVTRAAEGGWRFHLADGRRIPPVPAAAPLDAEFDAQLSDVDAASSPVWDGARFDLAWAMDVLCRPPAAPVSVS